MKYEHFIKGEKMASRKMWVATAVVAGLTISLAACTGGGPTDTQSPDEKVSLTFWGTTQGQQAQVDLWNEKHPETQVTYVEQGGDADMTTALQNATAAGNAPDLFETPRGYGVSFLVDGVSRDLAEWFDADDKLAESALEFVHIGDVVVGVPYATNPTFNAVNMATFSKYGFEAPKTWDEFLTQAETMQTQGDVKSMNLPGEDPSYLRDLATQFGAEWWSPEGDAWKVGFASPESLAAGEVIQQAIDANVVSNHTYIEWDALMQFFASGQLSQFTTSTWQLPVYETNFASSVGDWALAPYPAESDSGDLVSPSYFNIYGVSAGSKHPEAAVDFAEWLATDPDAVAILADTTDGASVFPVVADPTPYIEDLLPSALLGDNLASAPEVVENAVATSRSMREGPNQVAATEEMVDWWARALTKEVTVAQLLEHMQEWTTADLESQNIAVVD
ncbi:MAG TPA: extracellular solute-binding protein [Microbacterium sp.]|uniref:ABC transporter substrate-binding protein n=1 Tax=Microbacterium sp. TaxID=51671 RepID=UPI002C459674|nr:extracellular solute-binding protein [Microbacterium sp.]HWI30060.1 extracellular solute-binding protein [Microbacterium sp.]